MRCLSRMGLGLVGLALVALPAAFADPPYSYTPDPAYSPNWTRRPHRRGGRCFTGCISAPRASGQTSRRRGSPCPRRPRCRRKAWSRRTRSAIVAGVSWRCSRVRRRLVDTPAPALSAVMAPPTALTLSESAGHSAAPRLRPRPRIRPRLTVPGPAFTVTCLPRPAPARPRLLASSPPLVPGPSSAPAWASVPASGSSLVVASMVAAGSNPGPPPAPAVVASNRTRPKRARTRSAPAPATSMASTGSPATACEACAAAMAAAGGDAAGHAIAGGSAVIGGTVPLAEPTPIGVIQGRYAYQDQSPGHRRRGGTAARRPHRTGCEPSGPGFKRPVGHALELQYRAV